MSLVDELEAALHDAREVTAREVATYDRADDAPYERLFALGLFAALAVRGIDLELAYQWQRAGAAAAVHDLAISVGVDGPGIVARAYDSMGDMHKDGWSNEYDEEWSLGEKGVTATPAAALSALADALEGGI